MLMRHGERYPDATTAAGIDAALVKVYGANISHWQGDLTFLSDWMSGLGRFCGQ
jgi:hypothetical protein